MRSAMALAWPASGWKLRFPSIPVQSHGGEGFARDVRPVPTEGDTPAARIVTLIARVRISLSCTRDDRLCFDA